MTHEPAADQSPSQKISRKQRRRQQQVTSSDNELSLPPTHEIISSIQILAIAPPMANPIRLLVCSIGNPAPYTNTLHSAGHILNTALAQFLSYPSFIRSREYGKGLLSSGSEFTLWQSTSYMNVSGEGVASAWRQFCNQSKREGRSEELGLVILHDELELALGKVMVKRGEASAKGHNGLKSIKEKLGPVKFSRIGVGIGRPVSREKDDVASYVLQKMSGEQKAKVEGAVGRVVEELGKLSRGER